MGSLLKIVLAIWLVLFIAGCSGGASSQESKDTATNDTSKEENRDASLATTPPMPKE